MATTLFLGRATSTRSSSSLTNAVQYLQLWPARDPTSLGTWLEGDNTIASLGTTGANGQVVSAWGSAATTTLAASPENWAAGANIFVTEPLKAVTVSGSITVNLRALESAAQANYGVGAVVYKIAAGGGAMTKIGANTNTTELGTTDSARSITITPTSTALSDGDMLCVIPIWCAAGGTSTASGRTATASYNGGASATTGDSFITFTETIGSLYTKTGSGVINNFVGAGPDAWTKNVSGKAISDFDASGPSFIPGATYQKTGTGTVPFSPYTSPNDYSNVVKATPNLTSYYRLNGDATDSFGGNNGTFIGGSPSFIGSLVNDGLDQAGTFTSSKDVSVPRLFLYGATDWTIEIWFRTSIVGTNQILYREQTTDGRTNVIIANGSTVGLIALAVNDDAGTTRVNNVLHTTNVADGKVHHLVMAKDSTGAVTTWIDAIQNGPQSFTFGTQTEPLSSASINATSGAGTTGDLDEIAFYSRVLTQSEVTAHYATGVKAFRNTDAVVWSKTGSGIAPFTGGGSKVFIAGGVETDKTGKAVSPFTGNGPSQILYSETGSPVSPFTGQAADAFTDADSGSAVSPFTGHAADALTDANSGSAVSPLTGSGPDISTFSRTGSAISDFDGSGPKTLPGATYIKAGIAVWGTIASASDKTGRGIAPFTGSGTEVFTLNRTGSGVSPFTGSGADADTFSETGAGVSPFTGSGADAATFTKTGKGISDFDGSGAKVFTSGGKTGAGISPFTGGGADVDIWTKTGSGVSPFTGAGADVDTDVGTGKAVSDFDGSGVRNDILNRKNTGISDFDGIGTRACVYTKAGSGIAPFTGSGNHTAAIVKRGFAVAPFTGGGTDSDALSRSGAAVAPLSGSGASAPTYAETGRGIAPFAGGGTSALVSSKTGSGVSPFTGSGADADAFAESGAAVAPFTGSGASAPQYAESGAGVSPFTGRGADVDVLSETGAGVAPFSGSANTAITYSETGTGSSAFTGSGSETLAFGGVTRIETGSGVAPFTGHGVEAIQDVNTGDAATAFTGTGDGQWVLTRTGSAVAPLTGGGTKAATFPKSGEAVSVFTGSGSRSGEKIRTGSATSDFTGSGTTSGEKFRFGSAVIEFVGRGFRNVILGLQGTAISVFTGQGRKRSARKARGHATATTSLAARPYATTELVTMTGVTQSVEASAAVTHTIPHGDTEHHQASGVTELQ